MPPVALPNPPLTDGAVTLRGWREDDVDALFAAAQDPEIPRWTIRVPSPFLIGHARDWIGRQPEILRSGDAAHFAIVDARTEELLGTIGLELHTHSSLPEVGYWLAARARGRGVATRAVTLVCEWGTTTLGLEEIGLRTHEANVASQAVARRAGFDEAGTVTGNDRDGVEREFRFFVYRLGRKSAL